MNFNNLDFLIYSSHKTSTQSLVSTLNQNRLRSIHCHIIDDFTCTLPSYRGIITDKTFIKGLTNYKNINKKKIKIITIIRNPKDRLISSFFQTFHTDEVSSQKKGDNKTTISLNNVDTLYKSYKNLIIQKELLGRKESIDEMSEIFKINIIENLEKRKDYYYFNHNLFELYVLDFNKLIKLNESINYINDILGTTIINIDKQNLSNDKSYYNKYINVKKMIEPELNNIIETQYHPFYFTSFDKDDL